MGDASNTMDRFDARLLLEEMPQAGQAPRSVVARAAWEAAAAITDAEPVDEETLNRERYRGLGDSSDSEDSSGEGTTISGPTNSYAQCLAKCPFTCQFDRLSDEICQSLDRLSDHFAKHCLRPWRMPGILAQGPKRCAAKLCATVCLRGPCSTHLQGDEDELLPRHHADRSTSGPRQRRICDGSTSPCCQDGVYSQGL
jgi:hypothetical protein